MGFAANLGKLSMRLFIPLLLLCLTATPALADCVDPPGPGVDWTRCYFDGREFQSVDLAGAALKEATFSRGDLSGANLSGVRGSRAKFISATLAKTDFSGAALREADFTNADLSDASFVGADLRRARLFRANLRGVDFTNARMRGADLLEADLSGALWIDGKSRCAEGSLGQCR